MERNKFDLNDLRVFCALASGSGFRAVAEDIGLSASALSRQIARMEERLGTRLFNRDTRNVSLTPQGETLLRLAERVLNTAANAGAEFDAYLAAHRGRLTIAGLPSVTAGLLPSVVARFLSEHPDIDVQINDALSDQVIRSVEQGEADLGFTAGAVETSDRISFRHLLSDRFVAVGAAGGALSEPRSYTWEELVRQPFVAMARGTSVRDLIEAACSQQNLLFRPRFEVAHLATAGAFVSQGLGVTALPVLTLPVLRTGSLIYRRLSAPEMVRQIGVIWRAGHVLSPAATAFLDLVRSADLSRGLEEPLEEGGEG
ncbi:LysR family transcriptional regulator [Roseibium aggregatum]|uniref:LysR family transcriptional regulator n=1 Tax=Roseibium aggregatum TaxID=187304 RepID=A0A939J0W2_9HYPH|nr:LysR family transcriptional regulator [Roseibium aggregatum]MBN9671501.1 LysR family transcriptional regulator [Roseibium aggregatum]